MTNTTMQVFDHHRSHHSDNQWTALTQTKPWEKMVNRMNCNVVRMHHRLPKMLHYGLFAGELRRGSYPHQGKYVLFECMFPSMGEQTL